MIKCYDCHKNTNVGKDSAAAKGWVIMKFSIPKLNSEFVLCPEHGTAERAVEVFNELVGGGE